MPIYYVDNNARTNGDHDVHEASCRYLPNNTTPLGQHSNCQNALRAASLFYHQVNGCFWCTAQCYKAASSATD